MLTHLIEDSATLDTDHPAPEKFLIFDFSLASGALCKGDNFTHSQSFEPSNICKGP